MQGYNKILKKSCTVIAAILAFILLSALFLQGCSIKTNKAFDETHALDDYSYVLKRGRILVGVTVFKPMYYKKRNTYVGFDTELARLFAKRLGIEVEFKEIDWNKRIQLINKKEIDLIWNGMGKTEQAEEELTCSDVYLKNELVVVMPKDELEKLDSVDMCGNLLFSCENGDSCEDYLKEGHFRYIGYETQKEALMAAGDRRVDATIIDGYMARNMTGEKTYFPNLAYDYPLYEERVCVGLRKDSNLLPELNKFLAEVKEDGTIKMLANKYGITELLFEE